jgi:hypothetical protein
MNCILCEQPREAARGLLCMGHYSKLAQTLVDLGTEYDALSAVPSMQVRSGRGGSLSSTRSPAVLDAIVASDPRRGQVDYSDPWALDETASVLGTLHSWARVVRYEMGLTAPRPIDVATERSLLQNQLEWISAAPFIDDLYADLVQLLAQLRNTNHTAPERSAGRCYLPNDDGTCTGNIRRQENTYQHPGITVTVPDGPAYCDTCGTTWTGEDLALLAAEIERQNEWDARPRTTDGRAMWTAQEIAQHIGKTTNAVKIQATRRGLTGNGGYFDPDDFRQKVTA